MTDNSANQLDAWLALRDLDIDQAAAKFGLTSDQAIPNRQYGGLSGMCELRNPDAHAGAAFFQDDTFVLFYVEDLDDGLAALKPESLQRRFGKADAALPSRAGKRSRQHVYADQGIAYSSDGDTVEFLEVFAPTTLEEYRERFYQAPRRFTR